MVTNLSFPRQNLPYSKKNKKWREDCVKWAKSNSTTEVPLVRKSVHYMKVNYDLLNGKLSKADMKRVLNPYDIKASYIPDTVQHYPIMNSKINVLRGEETRRLFDYKVVVTNPTAISEVEESKKAAIIQSLQQLIQNNAQSEEDVAKEMEKLSDYFTHSWQDLREVRGNFLLNHYIKELNIPLLFNNGFVDAMAVGEEIYRCSIVAGEPYIERLNPQKVRIFKSGYSNKIEDAEVIVIEDYWSTGKIIDYFHEDLTQAQIELIESGTHSSNTEDSPYGHFIPTTLLNIEGTTAGDAIHSLDLFGEASIETGLPYDTNGNTRVLQVYWKSRRKVKKVKSYNPDTGEEEYNLYPETYITNKDAGEEEKILWINEAWEGTCIGEDIYINIRPRAIQYNRLSNPSRCHFGIVGSIYNLNDSKPFSLVDMMKPYNYLYNAIHDKLNKAISDNWGTIVTVDLAKVPKGWDVNKWIHFAKTNHLAVVDSFNEGNIGAATGKLAGSLNNASSGVINAEIGNSIQHMMHLLEFIKNEMSDVAGISRQREGQIYNRETVGGVERSNLQSAHITEWLFTIHEDTKRRVLECFLETAKIALKDKNVKMQNLLPDHSTQIMMIGGEEFAEADYGLLVDNSYSSQELNSKLEGLAQAALQGQLLSFSSIMKLFSSASLAEKQRIIEKEEQQKMQQAQEQQQQQMQMQQEMLKQQQQQHQDELAFKDMLSKREADTQITIARIRAEAQIQGGREQMVFRLDDDAYSEEEKEDMARKKKEHEDKMAIAKEKLELERKKLEATTKIKKEELKTRNNNKNE